MKKIIVVMFLIGCGRYEAPLENSSDESTKKTKKEDTYRVYYTSKDHTSITGEEDVILECIVPDGYTSSMCENICISDAFPEYKRYDLFMTYYLPDNRCEFYIFSSDEEYEYYEGIYNNHKCTYYELIESGTFLFSKDLSYLYLYSDIDKKIPISSPGGTIFRNKITGSEYFLMENCKKGDVILDFVDEVTI